MSPEDQRLLDLWFQAYEPCVSVDVVPDRIVMRSMRPGRGAVLEVEVPRSTDMYMDLDAALRRVVLLSS